MTNSPAPWAVSRTAAEVLVAAGSGVASLREDLLRLVLAVAVALGRTVAAFAVSARRRG